MSSRTADETETREWVLRVGQLVILHPEGPAGGFPMVAAVEHVRDGWHWFRGSCEPLRVGETLIVESPIQDDARYVSRAEISALTTGTFALSIEPVWERVQQRSFVRISAHGLQVRVVRVSAPAPPREAQSEPTDSELEVAGTPDDVFELLDLSAGGVRFASDEDYEPDEEVVCHFELPGSHCFVLPARVVRTPEGLSRYTAKPSIAVEFAGLDEHNRSQLLRWVYREQVRRHRIDQRREDAEQSREARDAKRRQEASRR